MKRFFAILLSAMLLTACSEKTAEEAELIDLISETESAVVEIEDEAETTELSSETEETTTVETTIATEETTASEAIVKQDFPLGKWTETRLYKYEFDDKGKVTIDTFHNSVTGDYTYENNILEMNFETDDDYKIKYVFSVTESDNGVNLTLNESTDQNGWFVPFEPGGLVTGYMTVLTGLEELTLTAYNKEPVFADADDLKGAWVSIDYEYDYYEDILYVFSDNSVTEFSESIDCQEMTVENGVGIYSEEANYPKDYVKLHLLYDGKLYISDNYGNCVPEIMERYEETAVINTDDLDGEYILKSDERGLLSLEDGKGTLSSEGYSVPVEIIVKDGTFSIASEHYTETFKYYIFDDSICLVNDENSALMSKVEWPGL